MNGMEQAMIDTYECAKQIRMNSESNRGSMHSTISRLKPRLCSARLPESYFRHISPILDIIPDAAADTFMLEYKLEEEQGFPDFSVCFWNERSVTDILAGQDPYVHIPPSLYTHTIWRQLRDFWIHWRNSANVSHHLANFWLEFDINETIQTFPVPLAFIRVNTAQYQEWSTDALQIIMGKTIPNPTKQQLRRLFELLPAGARVSQIGSLQARCLESLRLYIKIPGHREMACFLRQMDYPGNLEPVMAFFDGFANWGGYLKLQLDIGPEILPKIAVEFLDDTGGGLWKPLIAKLCDKQLCAGANREFLLNWPDSALVREPGGNRYLHLYKYISHIKVIYEPKIPLAAKAYLGVTYS